MFRVIAVITLAAALGGMVVHLLLARGGERFVKLQTQARWLRVLTDLAWALLGLSVAVLGVIGFAEAVVEGEAVHGYALMAHVTFGGVFAFAAAVVLLLDGYLYRFEEGDFRPGRRNVGWRKVFFWATMALVVPVTLSTVVSMTGLFGSVGQAVLLEVHRYATLGFTVTALWLGYLAVRTRKFKIQNEK